MRLPEIDVAVVVGDSVDNCVLVTIKSDGCLHLVEVAGDLSVPMCSILTSRLCGPSAGNNTDGSKPDQRCR